MREELISQLLNEELKVVAIKGLNDQNIRKGQIDEKLMTENVIYGDVRNSTLLELEMKKIGQIEGMIYIASNSREDECLSDISLCRSLNLDGLISFLSSLKSISNSQLPWLIFRSVKLEDTNTDSLFTSIVSEAELLLEENRDLFSSIDIVRLP